MWNRLRRWLADLFGNSLHATLADLQATNERLLVELDERRRDETALRESEKHYRSLFENALEGMFRAQPGVGFTDVNPALLRMLGYESAAEIQTLKLPEDLYVDLEHRRRLDQQFDTRGFISGDEVLWKCKDGRSIVVSLYAQVIRDEQGRLLRYEGAALDITERRRAEEDLRKNEELYRTLARNFPNGTVMMFDFDLRYTLVDGAGLAEAGLSPETMEGKTIWEVFPPEVCARIEPQYRAALAGTTIIEEMPFKERIYIVHTLPVKNKRGDILAGMVMTQDITEQMRASETLRRQNAYLTGLHETTLALMNRLDLEDLFQTIVAHAARLISESYGFLYLVDAPAAVLELKVSSGLFDPTPTPRLKPGEGVAGVVWQTGQMLMINNYDQWPGRATTIPYGAYHALMCAPLKVGEQVVGVIGLLRVATGRSFDENEAGLLNGYAQLASIAFDNARLYADAQRELTARTQAIAALRDSEEQYRLITENTRDLIMLLDQEGCCVYASPSCTSILGYAQIELIGTAFIDIVHPDDRVAVAEQMQQLAASSAAQAAFRARHASDTWRWIETFWTATTQDGMRYNLAVGRDITERKRLEAQFLQAQKMEGIGRLAGGVAHDFNNLLTAIMSYTELARDGLTPGDPVAQDLDEVAGAARRAADLTSQLLAFARKQIIEPQALNLNTLLKDMDRLLRRVIGEDVELEVRLAPELGYVKADHGQIEQVLINMAVNARDAMPNGGKLIVETRNIALDPIFAEQHIGLESGTYVLLEISDTGIGMDAETQRQVFEPFFTTKERGRGTGLGLATCYGIIKQHGGSIVLYSELGLGSTFKVYLPCVAAPRATAPRQEAPAAAPNGSETILLAEDESAVRTLASRVLRERGYTVIEAVDGVEALRMAQECNGTAIDLLLTDMVMPRMGGGALATRIQELYPGIRVLFISGYTDSALIQHGQLANGMEFMHKPFSPADLARKVRELLDS
jgi:PAS domain S-box-containing protein